MNSQTVLVIDDNAGVRTALEILLPLNGFAVALAPDPDGGLARLAAGGIDLVIQDMNFGRDTTSGEEGVQLFHAIGAPHPHVPVILLMAWTNLETAIELVRCGAADYLPKPWDDVRLVTTVRNLLALGRATAENAARAAERPAVREALDARFDLRGAVYESEAMHELFAIATQVAHADVPVLITGLNGAGKEVLAEVVQANSAVRGGPFVRVNAGALPAELVESELFGAEAGAYTGAGKLRLGRFESADGGTLFLDEIGNLPLAGQAKLLRVLESREFERLGSSVTRRVKVRLIAASNADLKAGIRVGTFREEPLLPPQGDRAQGSSARQPQERHPAAGAPLPRLRLRVPRRCGARAPGAHLAWQRPRAQERGAARLPAFAGQAARGGEPWARDDRADDRG